MGMTRSELIAEAGNIIGDTSMYNTRMKTWLNMVQRWIARLGDWPELKSMDTTSVATVADQISNPWPKRWKVLHNLILIDGASTRKIDFKLVNTFSDLWPRVWSGSGTTSRPERATRFGNDIYWQPIPNDAYACYGNISLWPVEFNLDNQESEFENKDDAIVCGLTAATYLFGLEEPREFKTWVGNMMEFLSAHRGMDRRGTVEAMEMIMTGSTTGMQMNDTVVTDTAYNNPFINSDF
jgi:hypothetical protein